MKLSRIFLSWLLFAILIFEPPRSEASYGVFAAVGPGLTFPAAARLMMNDWEIGILDMPAVGIAKIARKSSFYAAFGPAAYLGPETGAGFYSGLGWQPALGLGLSLRFEIAATAFHFGLARAEALAGLNWAF